MMRRKAYRGPRRQAVPAALLWAACVGAGAILCAQMVTARAGWIAISGTVRVDGRPKPPAPVPITLDTHVCGDGEALPRALIVSPDRELQNAVVTLTPPPQDGAPAFPTGPFVIDQQKCRYEPHLTLVPTNTPVTFKSSDSVLHNVRSVSTKNESFNQMFSHATNRTEWTTQFEHAERIELVCDFHTWMRAWVVVLDNPYVAVTDERGAFTLPPVPEGEYTLSIWHELWGEKLITVTVPNAGVLAPVEASFDAKDLKRK